MSVLKIFKNTPGRPMGGRQALDEFFLLQICNEVHGRKKNLKGGLSPPSPADDRGGACRPPSGDRAMPPYISSRPHSLVI